MDQPNSTQPMKSNELKYLSQMSWWFK